LFFTLEDSPVQSCYYHGIVGTSLVPSSTTSFLPFFFREEKNRWENKKKKKLGIQRFSFWATKQRLIQDLWEKEEQKNILETLL
jgi:hypothetical protein